MNFLAITYSFMLAWSPVCCPQSFGQEPVRYENSTRVEYQLGVDLLDMLHIYTGESTRQFPDDGDLTNWVPFQQTYWVGAELHHEFNEKVNLHLGVRHECSHPVDSWNFQSSDINSSYTDIYLGVSGKFDLF